MSDQGFVRLAWPTEAVDIVSIQLHAWSQHPLMAASLDEADPSGMAKVWHEAILRPPSARHRVLVALEGPPESARSIVGFVAVGPSDDPDAAPSDALVFELEVDPDKRGAGHGSRLLNAAVDTLRADGFVRATVWTDVADERGRAFWASTGWADDGASRTLAADDDRQMTQARMHTLVQDA